MSLISPAVPRNEVAPVGKALHKVRSDASLPSDVSPKGIPPRRHASAWACLLFFILLLLLILVSCHSFVICLSFVCHLLVAFGWIHVVNSASNDGWSSPEGGRVETRRTHFSDEDATEFRRAMAPFCPVQQPTSPHENEPHTSQIPQRGSADRSTHVGSASSAATELPSLA